jgi:membrane-associated phospholipid phosphatase
MRMKRERAQALLISMLIILCFFLPDAGFGLENRKEQARLNASFLRLAGKDLLETLSSPAGWDSGDWLGFAAVAGTGILLFTQDEKNRDWIQNNRGKITENIGPYIRPFGNGLVLFGLLSGTYLSGEILDSDSLRKTALMGLQSWLTAGTVVTGIKLLSGRSRPNTGQPHDDFHLLAFSLDRLSFPSGDTASAFAVATVIAGQTRPVAVDILAYSMAGLVGYYRVHDNKHWISDVFIGAVIGWAVGRKIRALHSLRARSESPRLTLSPCPGGLSISLRF